MRKPHLSAAELLLVGTIILAGCKNDADSFFSGRPSGMAMVHNQIIAGPPESLVELLRIPARFPQANSAQITDWQGSLIVWWKHPEKHELMISSFRKISRYELHNLIVWVRVRDMSQTVANSSALTDIEAALNAVTPPP
jgi:hypothetical protein